jgi:hypothetical protein
MNIPSKKLNEIKPDSFSPSNFFFFFLSKKALLPPPIFSQIQPPSSQIQSPQIAYVNLNLPIVSTFNGTVEHTY